MIGDIYRIKYSDYVLQPDGITDNGRYLEIDATDRVQRPGINTTNFVTASPTPLDLTFYGYRSQGYGADLWNNMFYMLENFAQPSAAESLIPQYSANTIVGQFWVDTTYSPATPRYYGTDHTFHKLGASIDIDSVPPTLATDLWFDTTTYSLKYNWNDISCVPYVSQLEYNTLVTDINHVLTVNSFALLTGNALPTASQWEVVVSTLRILGTQYNPANPVPASGSIAGDIVDRVVSDNFAICHANSYSIATIKSVFTGLQRTMHQIMDVKTPPEQLPLAGFLISTTVGAIPMVVTFTDNSSQTLGASYAWDFGDGSPKNYTAGTVTHTYATLGAYTPSLTLLNTVGTTTTSTKLKAFDVPIVSFTVGPDANIDASLNTPFPVHFTDLTTNDPVSWLWDFGDGTTSSEQNPDHVYMKQGLFNIKLTATNIAGSATRTLDHQVQVGIVPVANFTYSNPVSGSTPFDVAFTDTSLHKPETWLWNFGDGATSAAQNPTHTYTSWGRFTVSLTASNPVPGSSTNTVQSLVAIGNVPVSSYTVSPATGVRPLTVQFNDTSSDMPASTTRSWFWEFGDGATSTEQNPVHQYNSQGRFTVYLTVTNPLGSSRLAGAQVQVGNIPVANFSYTNPVGSAPLTVSFTDTSGNVPESWSWNFGDGATSSTQNPSHQYTTGGVFSVSLTASNPLGSNTRTMTNLVSTQFRFNITLGGDEQNVNLATKLYNTGWDGRAPAVGTFTINSGVVISANSTGQYALRTGQDFPAGSSITLINNGYIIGMGGQGGNGNMQHVVGTGKGAYYVSDMSVSSGLGGGPALVSDAPGSAIKVQLYNYGIIGGGGGGGGGAYSPGALTSPGGGGGRSGRTNSMGGSGGFGSYQGSFGGAGGGISPSGHGNSGPGGNWGGGGSYGSAWPGDYVASYGGGGGNAVVNQGGFVLPLGSWGTIYGAII